MNSLEKIITVISFCALVGGGFLAFGEVKEKVNSTKEEVEEAKQEAKKTKEKVIENEKINIEQTILINQAYKVLEKLDKKLDKDLKE
jgi:hypothetical protein